MNMRITPENDEVTIVLVGQFNPAIFTPAWFALHGLLSDRVAVDAKGIVNDQISQFEFDTLNLRITVGHFVAGTALASCTAACDFVICVFKEHLHHTPVTAFGINRDVHFRVRHLGALSKLGRTLAPVRPWKDLLNLDSERSGMTSLRMSQSDPAERPAGGQINVTVEPSVLIRDRGGTGVYVGLNDHYVPEKTETGTAKRCMELLKSSFYASLERSEKIVDHIMSLATE